MADETEESGLLNVATEEVKQILAQIRSRKIEIYAFALCVDDDVSSAYAAFNTEESLARKCGTSDEDYLFYRFYPDEWTAERDSGVTLNDALSRTSEIMSAVEMGTWDEDDGEDDEGGNDRAEKEKRIFLLAEAMKRAADQFGKEFDGVLFFVNISDAEKKDLTLMMRAVEQFSSPEHAAEFRKYLRL